MFDGNIVTCKLGEQVTKHTVQVEAECSHIFYKNYKNLYPMTNEVLDRMVKISEVPKPLLDKLVTKFPQEYRDEYYQQYENMYNLRVQALQNLKNQ